MDPSSPSGEAQVGSNHFNDIAGYHLLELLGSGGFANTYKAAKAGRQYAVKLFNELPTGVNAKRFDREVEALQLEHPNLVRYVDSGIARYGGLRRPFIVMPFIPGQTLRAAIDAGEPRLSPANVQEIGAAVADGLAFLHFRNIAHRDLTPKNIYITDTGEVLVLDFGLVRLQDRSSLTLKGEVLGTLAYCAPEQLRNEPDLHTDIYGLGATLYHALTGQLPFPATSLAALLEMIRNEEPERPSVHNPFVSDALDDLILSMLAKEPVQRPTSAEAIAEALRRPESAPVPKPPPYDRDSDPILAIRATTPSAARAVLGAAMTGEVPDLGIAAITTPPVLAEMLRAAGLDPRMRFAVDTRVESTASAVMPKTVRALPFAPPEATSYSADDLRASESSQRVARGDISVQSDEGANLLRSSSFTFSGAGDPWLKRSARLLVDGLHARDALDGDAPLYATLRCDVDGLMKRGDRISIANRYSRGRPDGFSLEFAGLSANSEPEVISAAFDMIFLLQERGVVAIASLPGPLVELGWTVGVGGAEVKLGRVGGWYGPSVRSVPTGDRRPRFEFPSIFGSYKPKDAIQLLELDILPESGCRCPACRLAAESDARVAVADAHGLAAWLELRAVLSGLSVEERVERLRGRLDEAETYLGEVRRALADRRHSSRHVRTLRSTLDHLERDGALGSMGSLRRSV